MYCIMSNQIAFSFFIIIFSVIVLSSAEYYNKMTLVLYNTYAHFSDTVYPNVSSALYNVASNICKEHGCR